MLEHPGLLSGGLVAESCVVSLRKGTEMGQAESDTLVARASVALPVLPFRPLVIDRAAGSYVWATDGRKLLDLNSGQFCSIFGHSDARLRQLLFEIGGRAQDTDTSTLSTDAILGLEALVSTVPEMSSPRGILLSTGGEANEFILKYAKHLTERDGVLSFDRGYHGLSHGVAAYSMSRDRIRPTLPFSYSAPTHADWKTNKPRSLSDAIAQLRTIVKDHWRNISAMIFEPIISGGGLLFPPSNYFEEARKLCDDHGILLVFDECQTGMGRLGTWFGFQKIGVVPDAITSSKGLGAGFPVGAVVMDGSLVPDDGFQMQYFSSHQNEPFAGAITSFVVQRIENDGLLSVVEERGAQLHAILEKLERDSKQTFCARGDGLLRGFDLVESAHTNKASARGPRLTEIALEEGLMLQHCNYGNTVRILPNYLCTEAEIDEFGDKLKVALSRLGFEN